MDKSVIHVGAAAGREWPIAASGRSYILVLLASSITAGCGSYDNAAFGGGGPGQPAKDAQSHFDSRVRSSLDFCRNCHVPGGVADVDDGRKLMLSADRAQDYGKLQAAWTALGKGVEGNDLLRRPSGQESHSGGSPWPQGSAPYTNMRILLGCWENPASCAALLAGGLAPVEQLPLLGNPGKHFFVNQLCDGKPDSTPIDWEQDPRRLMMGELIGSTQYAVHFNDPYELCHLPTLFETQARQNELRVAKGQKPIYSARPDPANCGEWRAAVQEGHDWIAMSPTDSPREGGHGNGNSIAGQLAGTDAAAWNNLWKVWGMSERPANFDMELSQRYGHTPAPAHIDNPYPVVDADSGIDERPLLTASFGGSGRLPLGYAQGRDAAGNYSGTIGLTCFSCHAGQIGSGEITGRDGNGNAASYGANPHGSYMGLPNSNTELGVLIADLIHAQQPVNLNIPAFGYLPLVNTTRGTNAADTEIEAIFLVRDWDTLEFSRVFADPLHPGFGDQDPPAWWWLHNKARYLWFGGHSTDSARGNMYFGSVNGLSGDDVKHNEGIFESVHQWTLTVEAPDYPGPVDTALAGQGAILFHEKDLWADAQNAEIPRPEGNGSCAGCHGAYSPRYANDPRFLPDPRLIGTNSYTVPIEIIGTDPAQTEGWAMTLRNHVSTMWHSYPDAVDGYRLPEEKSPLAELLDDYAVTDGLSGANLADQLGRQLRGMGVFAPVSDVLATVMGTALVPVPGIPTGPAVGRVQGACGFPRGAPGYVTPPLHGVWASGPYFHNGSVPTVWDVLSPDERPAIWRRQRSGSDVHFKAFETQLTGTRGAYDFTRMGWNYEVLACSDGGQGIPYYQCQPAQEVPPEIDWVKTVLTGGLLWPTWVVPPPIGDRGLEDRMIFNTNLYSKKNTGHEWTRALTDAERRALLEYLKTL